MRQSSTLEVFSGEIALCLQDSHAVKLARSHTSVVGACVLAVLADEEQQRHIWCPW